MRDKPLKHIKFAELRLMAKAVAERMPSEDLLTVAQILQDEIEIAQKTQIFEEIRPLLLSTAAYIGERLAQRWSLKWQQKNHCSGFPSLAWHEDRTKPTISTMFWVMQFYRAGRSIVDEVKSVPRFLATDGEYRTPAEMFFMFEYLAAWFNETYKYAPSEKDAEEELFAYIADIQEHWTTENNLYSGVRFCGSYLGFVYGIKFNGEWHYDEAKDSYGILMEDGKFIDPFKKVENYILQLRQKALLE
jgi:hypothetical protein